jgi:hypothetical protein
MWMTANYRLLREHEGIEPAVSLAFIKRPERF